MPQMPAKKSNRIQTLERVELIRSMLLQGASSSKICQFAAEKWEISKRQVERYIERATKEIQTLAEKDAERELAEHLAIRRDLRMRAHSHGNLRLVLEIVRDEARLLNLYRKPMPELDAIATLLDAGLLDADHARALAEALEELPSRVSKKRERS